jgi:raffinose/stachyose/melibiose transport system permease protein
MELVRRRKVAISAAIEAGSAGLTMTQRAHAKLRGSLRYLVLVPASVIVTYPMFWLVTVALKDQTEYAVDPVGLPRSVNLGNFISVLADSTVRSYAINTLVIVLIAVPIVTLTCAAAGYALARLWRRGGGILMLTFLLSEFIPVAILVVPLYLTVTHLGIEHGVIRLIFAYSVVMMGFSILVFRGFFRSIPEELREAARLDGASELQVFLRIMVPLARSPLTVIGVIAFLYMWNEFFVAAVLVDQGAHRTLPLGMSAFQGQYVTDWPKVAALLVLTTIPTLILYALFQGRIASPFSRSTTRG